MGEQLLWFRVEHAMPAKGERVMVAIGDHWQAARLTNIGWLDDQSKIVRGVERWSYVTVSKGEK